MKKFRLLFCVFGLMFVPEFLFCSHEASRIRRLNLEGSMYVPGGEPVPLMIWVPREEIEGGGSVLGHISFALKCFHIKLPRTVQQAQYRSNQITLGCYEDELIKVAVGRDDMQKLLNALNQ